MDTSSKTLLPCALLGITALGVFAACGAPEATQESGIDLSSDGVGAQDAESSSEDAGDGLELGIDDEGLDADGGDAGDADPDSGGAGDEQNDDEGWDGEDPRFDLSVPDSNDEGGSGGDGDLCEGVDFLFVIDNSISMRPYQEELARSFPGFVDKIVEALPWGTSVHVGVTTTSFSADQPGGDSAMQCISTNGEDIIRQHYDLPTELNNGLNGSQGRLFEYDGLSYFDGELGKDDAALKDWFSQAAVAPGDQGCTLEMMTAAAGFAAHPANDATNAGFIRDEGSVLVVFLLSDEHDKSPDEVESYIDMIAEAKRGCGGLNCVIGAGLLEQECYEHDNSPTMKTFLDTLNGGPSIVGEIKCEPGVDCDYPKVVGDALAGIILETCKSIDPPA